MKSLRLGNTLAALALGGALVLATAPKAHADDHDGRSRCQNRVEKANQQMKASCFMPGSRFRRL